MIHNRGDRGFNVETFEGKNHGRTISSYQENYDVLKNKCQNISDFLKLQFFESKACTVEKQVKETELPEG